MPCPSRPWALALLAALLLAGPSALADNPPADSSAPSAPPATPPSPAPSGLVVLATAGATDAAWPLAQAIYVNSALRPATLDDASARVLCGEAAPAGAPPALLDLVASVGAVHGDDAPSRAVLDAIARRFHVRAIVVVTSPAAAHPSARAYLPDAAAFDAATYAPDPGVAPAPSWNAAAQSLARTFSAPAGSTPAASEAAGPPASPRAPLLATHSEPAPPAHPGGGGAPSNGTGKPFWQNGWFWGAVGAAVFGAGAVYFLTRDNTGSTIHLEAEVPR
jgi:hypothetical protein